MKGCVDHVGPTSASGWVLDPARRARAMQVRLSLDGRVVAQGIADQPRPGVGKLYRTDGKHGFRFDGLALTAEEQARLAVEARAGLGASWLPILGRPGPRPPRRRPADGTRRVTVVGTSHMAALLRALPPDQDRFEFVHLNRPRSGLSHAFPADWREPPDRYVALFKATLDPDSHFVSMLGGNDHNALGLIEHPQRFDVLEPGEDAPEVEPGRELIPYDALRAMLEQRIDPYLRWLAALAPAFAGRKLHVCSPPPVPSAHIRSFPGMFQSRLRHGVTPPRIRAKLHRMSSDIFATGCSGVGMDFLPPPGDAADADGFLKAPYWNEDPTHGNGHYGELLLKQIEEHLAA